MGHVRAHKKTGSDGQGPSRSEASIWQHEPRRPRVLLGPAVVHEYGICLETCDAGGFEVAKGTRLIVNSWAIARSSKYWDDAEEFRPERFEKSTIDYNGTQFEFLTFGSGRRMCPGMSFGLVTLQLIVARLLYFNWDLPAGMLPKDLSMDMSLGASARRKNQLQLVSTPYQATSEI